MPVAYTLPSGMYCVSPHTLTQLNNFNKIPLSCPEKHQHRPCIELVFLSSDLGHSIKSWLLMQSLIQQLFTLGLNYLCQLSGFLGLWRSLSCFDNLESESWSPNCIDSLETARRFIYSGAEFCKEPVASFFSTHR